MAASTALLQFLLMVVAGWLHRQQASVIEYLNAENRLLRERLGDRRIIFTDAERRNLAEKAKAVGRETLRELGTIGEERVRTGISPRCVRSLGGTSKRTRQLTPRDRSSTSIVWSSRDPTPSI